MPSLWTHTALLLNLVLLLLIGPLLSGSLVLRASMDVLYTTLFIIGTVQLSIGPRLRLFGLVLFVLSVVSRWMVYLTGDIMAVGSFGIIFDSLFVSLLVYFILRQIYQENNITWDTIAGAVSVYLLIGVCFMKLYCLIEIQHPGSFRLHETEVLQGAMMYYSLVTLTTLGFGDIVPLTDIARSLTTLEAVIGQMFIAVLVSRLVGLSLKD